jgi:hypothetical protein
MGYLLISQQITDSWWAVGDSNTRHPACKSDLGFFSHCLLLALTITESWVSGFHQPPMISLNISHILPRLPAISTVVNSRSEHKGTA